MARPVRSVADRYHDKVEAAGSNPARDTGRRKERKRTMKDVKQVIVVRKDLNMRKGKIAAQVAHASMKFLFDNNEAKAYDEIFVKLTESEQLWASGSFAKIVVGVESEDELRDLILKAQLNNVEVHSIIDSGRTEFHGEPTLTCAAFGPGSSEDLDQITGNLKLI